MATLPRSQWTHWITDQVFQGTCAKGWEFFANLKRWSNMSWLMIFSGFENGWFFIPTQLKIGCRSREQCARIDDPRHSGMQYRVPWQPQGFHEALINHAKLNSFVSWKIGSPGHWTWCMTKEVHFSCFFCRKGFHILWLEWAGVWATNFQH